MNTTRPAIPQLDTLVPQGGTPHRVKSQDTWGSLAASVGMDAWELIDFNFPGMRAVMQMDHELASRQVNWYLSEYVGCRISRDGGKNFAFSDGLTGGRGVHRGGVIFLPPARHCAGIDFSPTDILPRVQDIVRRISGVSFPLRIHARCLDAQSEVLLAKTVYGESLNYDNIYVSPISGTSNRPFTIALKLSGRWVVVLNMGSLFDRPGSDPSTLIHELAHAWQSQHHYDPQQFMINSVLSQGAASLGDALDSDVMQKALSIVGQPPMIPTESSAYAYAPGLSFRSYAAEQIAQQVEDCYYPPRGLDPGIRSQLWAIPQHMRHLGSGQIDSENILSLSVPRVGLKAGAGVVWH